jgi:EAL domain-containing protein (putative c-di-GMP-specific phosphodiesterase class I)
MKEMRADSIQGFFFSRPLAPQDAVEFAASHRARERLL